MLGMMHALQNGLEQETQKEWIEMAITGSNHPLFVGIK